MTREILFVTHAEVQISADIPVPDWPLTPRGRARHGAHAARLPAPDALWSSDERKATDAAAIYAKAWGLAPLQDASLGENDRSATGYLPGPAFEAAVDAFFGAPDDSFKGWETARAAQARIAAAIDRIAGRTAPGTLTVIAHGGVGALLLAHVANAPISRSFDQPGRGGGTCFRFTWPDRRLIHGWRDIAPDLA